MARETPPPSSPPAAASQLYLLIGPDRLRARRRVEELAARLHVEPLDRHETSAGELPLAALLTRCREHPALSPVRLIVVDEADQLDEAALDTIAQQAPALAATACLVLLMTRGPAAGHPIRATATVESFAWLRPAEVGRWIQDYAAGCHKRVIGSVLQELMAAHGADLPALRSALDQMIAWAGDLPELDETVLRQFREERSGVAAFGAPATAGKGGFALVDALTARDAAAALKIVDEQLAVGKDVVEIVGLVVWQLQRWLMVARLAATSMPAARIATATGMPAWQVERIQRELAGRSAAWILQMLRRCQELDLASKSGRAIPRLAFEQLIVELCLAAGAA